MRFNIVHLVFRRELRDALRDRRTVFLAFVLPVVLYPTILLLTFSIQQAGRQTLAREQHTVAVVGLADASALRAQLDEQAAKAATQPADRRAGLVRVVIAASEDEARQWVLDKHRPAADAPPVRVAVLAEAAASESAPASRPAERVRICFNSADERSAEAARLVRKLVGEYNRRFHPIASEDQDVKVAEAAPPWLAGILVYLLVLMSLTGAYYPAVDLVAGEKERGTIETLLCSPASRLELVVGKFLTVMSFSCITSLLNLGGMALTFVAITSMLPSGVVSFAVSPAAILYLALLLLPVAALFSAIALALSSFARSSKEAQLYMTPLMVLGVVLCMPVFGPLAGQKLSGPLALVPVTGPCLALVTLMTHSGPAAELPWAGLAGAFVSTYLWAALGIRWAARQFDREEVLFRESEAFDLRLWLRRALGRPRRLPRPGDVAVVFLLSLLGFVLLGPRLQGQIVDGKPLVWPTGMVLSQILLIAGPAVGMAALLARRSGMKIHDALSLRPGRAAYLLVLMPPMAVAAWVINQFLMNEIFAAYPPWRESAEMFSEQVLGTLMPLHVALLAIAVVPGVCEDLLFRGFLLNGLRSTARPGRAPWRAIVISGALFAAMHALGPTVQTIYAFLLGVPLAWIVWRTGSVWFGVLLHVCFNATSVVLGYLPKAQGQAVERWLADPLTATGLGAAAVAVFAAGIVLIHWLGAGPPRPVDVKPESAVDKPDEPS
jgi:sodium transport system permease protein